MSKKKRKEIVNGIEIDVPVDPDLEVVEDDEERELDEETAEEEEQEAVGDSEEGEEDEGEVMDWKEARSVLRTADQETTESIDDFDKRKVVDALKARYNNKERTRGLYAAINSLDD